MILRRLIASLGRQDWTAVAIEFVVLVVGIFLGLQVNNWNETRKEGLRGREYLRGIYADLGADIANLQNSVKFWAEVSSYGNDALAYAEGRQKTSDPWRVLFAFFQASQVNSFSTTRSTYDEITSAGEIGLIKNGAIRSGLDAFYVFANNPLFSESPDYREHVRGLIPVAVQDYLWDKCFNIAETQQNLVECRSPIDGAAARRIIIDTIAANAGVVSELRYWLSNLHISALLASNRMKTAEALRAKIATELGLATPH